MIRHASFFPRKELNYCLFLLGLICNLSPIHLIASPLGQSPMIDPSEGIDWIAQEFLLSKMDCSVVNNGDVSSLWKVVDREGQIRLIPLPSIPHRHRAIDDGIGLQHNETAVAKVMETPHFSEWYEDQLFSVKSDVHIYLDIRYGPPLPNDSPTALALQ